jgi:hypothetical protein
MNTVFKIINKPDIYTNIIGQKIINCDLRDLGDQTPQIAIGTFDKLYHFKEDWSNDEETIMAEWLCVNCTKNFIFSKLTSTILAGGASNPEDAIIFWKKRKKYYHGTNILEYFVKLYKEDTIAFELVWLTDFVYRV